MTYNYFTPNFEEGTVMEAPIKITDVINKSSAVLHSDGLMLYDVIVQEYNAHHHVIISFDDLNYCTTAFINASIGKFLENVDNPQQVFKHLDFIVNDELINSKIKRVTDKFIN